MSCARGQYEAHEATIWKPIDSKKFGHARDFMSTSSDLRSIVTLRAYLAVIQVLLNDLWCHPMGRADELHWEEADEGIYAVSRPCTHPYECSTLGIDDSLIDHPCLRGDRQLVTPVPTNFRHDP